MEDLDDIKQSLDFLSEEVSAVRLQQKMIVDLVDEVRLLKLQTPKRTSGNLLSEKAMNMAGGSWVQKTDGLLCSMVLETIPSSRM